MMVNRLLGKVCANSAFKALLFLLCWCVLAPISIFPRAAQSEEDHQTSQALWVSQLSDVLGGAGCFSALRKQGGLIHQPLLNEAGALVAKGISLEQAMRAVVYHAVRIMQFHHHNSSTKSFINWIKKTQCQVFKQTDYQEVGIYQDEERFTLLVSVPLRLPDDASRAQMVADVLRQINQARSLARNCGSGHFKPSSSLSMNQILEQVASKHAAEMAMRSTVSHVSVDGSLPAERAEAAGYHSAAFAENVAAGQDSAAAVMDAFLGSPGHCANIMNPDFSEIGIAFAVEKTSQHGIYWTLTFGRPAPGK